MQGTGVWKGFSMKREPKDEPKKEEKKPSSGSGGR